VTDYASTSTLRFWSEPLAKDLLRFLTGRLKCRETAADLTHETYLRLHRICRESPPDDARALAFHIAVNLAIDYQRKAAVRNRYGAEIDADTLHDTLAAKDSANPEQILMSKQRFGRLQQALDELPANCRTAFVLHSVEGLGYTEIAARMGISKSMVGKHLAKAMAHCAERLDEA
jgi:RNA polymerase sigma factor (sigma-70 family)